MVVVVRMVGWSQFMFVALALWSLITPILLGPLMSNRRRQLLHIQHHYYVILTLIVPGYSPNYITWGRQSYPQNP